MRVAEVEAVLAAVRPLILADGGDVRIVAVGTDGWIELKLAGACEHCFQSPLTVQGVLEPRLKAELAWVRGVRVARASA